MDCNQECYGSAFENECGCVGGSTGLEIDFCIGCTDPEGVNFNPDAFIEDGSCYYEWDILGCMNPEACNYNPDATYDDGSCLTLDCYNECGGTAYISECGCVEGSTGLDAAFCIGCSDATAMNYNPDVTIDDGSCEYGIPGDINQDSSVDVLDVVLLVDIILSFTVPTPYELSVADADCGGTLDIVDIVMIVNCVIHDMCDFGCIGPDPSRTFENSSISIEMEKNNHQLEFLFSAPISGLQFITRTESPLTPLNLPDGWEFHQRDGIVLLFDMSGDNPTSRISVSYNGSLHPEEYIIADDQGRKALYQAPETR